MNNFPRNRFSQQEMVRLFDEAKISIIDNEAVKTIFVNGDELEIYFPSENGNVAPIHLDKARRLIGQIPILDDAFQESCERDSQQSSVSVENYMLYLALIEIQQKGQARLKEMRHSNIGCRKEVALICSESSPI